ncbi:hypothetical protein GQ44DRAFT_626632, partial [Phaeosphaeriaceae sp. PMI808]
SQSYFAQYPEFEPECDKPFDEEFTRLAQSQDWVPNSQQYHEERTLAIKKEIRNEYWEPALNEVELSRLTQEERKVREDEWNISGYQTLLREVNQEPRHTVKECVEVLQKTLVNIVDLLDARRVGTKVEVFEYFQDFKAHTMKPGKRIHLATARKDAFLSTLLQKLSKSRSRNRKAYKISQVRKARVRKSA